MAEIGVERGDEFILARENGVLEFVEVGPALFQRRRTVAQEGSPLPRERCLAALARNLAHAAEAMAGIGVKVVVEAVNRRDRPGFFLGTTAEALEAIDRAGHANLGLEYDLYHMQIMEGDLVPTIRRHVARIGHIQFAATPGRHEPGTGEIDFPFVFDAIDAAGYDGWLGAEYVPSTERTEDSLGWFKPYRA